ncbi:MAG: tyrosine-protein phosphatase [bacterium]
MYDHRLVKLDGPKNFRDIGGCELLDGCKMKSGLIFRSDELSKLTRRDSEKLNQLNIKLVIDLRMAKECRFKPDRIGPNSKINYTNIPIRPSNNNISHIHYIKSYIVKRTGLNYGDFLKEHYKIIAFDRYSELREIFGLLSDKNNLPAVIHCSVGKDRTGFISALIQLLIGVSRDKILNDYLASNELTLKRRKQTIMFIRIISLFRISADQINPLFEARPEYIDETLDMILDRYKSIENYLISACGIKHEQIKSLKESFFE